MGGTGRNHDEPLLLEPPPDCRQPVRHVRPRRGREKELRRSTIRRHVERAGGFEVPLRNRHVPAVQIGFGGDQRRAGESAFRVPGPAARHEPAQRGAAETAVQIEPMGGPDRAQAAREIGDPFPGLERDDVREMGVLDHERRHRPLGDEVQLGFGMAAV